MPLYFRDETENDAPTFTFVICKVGGDDDIRRFHGFEKLVCVHGVLSKRREKPAPAAAKQQRKIQLPGFFLSEDTVIIQ
jgi:hypothetical protein